MQVDCFVLSFICLQYFSNYLDRANFANAYVSGMKEALGMSGHQFNTSPYFLKFVVPVLIGDSVNSMFTVGYTIAQVPQNLLLQFVPARILFPVNTLIWGGLTMATAAATNVRHLYVIRFFQGMAEASTFVGAGSWYKDSELSTRGAIFSSSAQIATIFSGVLQASIYTNLNGLHGIAGFRWLFIICGLITVPIALYGFLFFPDTPGTTKAGYFTVEERSLAVSRLPGKPKTAFDRTLLRRVFFRWRVYAMSLIWVRVSLFYPAFYLINSLMALWLEASGQYTIPQINYYPSGGTAVAIVALLGTALWTDYTNKRYQVNILICVCMVISASILLAYTSISTPGKFFAFYLAGVSYAGQAANFGWANDLARDDDQERSVILASMNMMSNAFNAWWSIVFFPANDAPRWRKGMISILVLCPIMLVLTVGTRMQQLRDKKRQASPASTVEEQGDEGKDERDM
ncbi:MFS transporter [Mycena chlorophos]|uniref:MFS transporter n=1 Tax=Mycena chlorophos TaxID=658473 RepID=A0A8H6TQ10_MYCCL|nr:MFS transporter [Mycena chlorophos]